MKATTRIFALLLTLCASALPANAGWVENAWDEGVASRFGHPAITINADGVSIVIPEATMYDSKAEGVSEVADVARIFLSHYGPGQCSTILDLTKSISGLRVKVSVQREKPLEDASAKTRDNTKDALDYANELDESESGDAKVLPKVSSTNIFEVDTNSIVVTIDYAPQRPIKCGEPPDKAPLELDPRLDRAI